MNAKIRQTKFIKINPHSSPNLGYLRLIKTDASFRGPPRAILKKRPPRALSVAHTGPLSKMALLELGPWQTQFHFEK